MKSRTSSDREQRRLVYMSTAQLKQMRALSKRAGVSQAALFREGIDLVLAKHNKARAVQS